MIRGTTLPKQTLPLLAAAFLLLPAIIVLAVWFNSQQDFQRRSVEREALDTARKVIALADAEVVADNRVLAVLAGSPSLRERDLSVVGERVQRLVSDNPDWNGLVVRNGASGEVILELSKRPGVVSAEPLPPLPRAISGPTAQGVEKSGRYCPCVILHFPVAGSDGQVMSLFLSPEVFQRLLIENAPNGLVSAVVDRDGRFLARTLDFPRRVGTPASTYARRVIRRGGEGLYRGITLEGAPNYSAYATSPMTGWSAHVAMRAAQIDNPRTWATASVAVGVLAGLVLAVGLLLYAVYETRRRKFEEERLVGMQKAEAISRFTGMLAHDSRNILAVIGAGVRLILRHTKEPETTERAKAIGEAVERGNRLINQLLSFVRGDAADVRELDLQDCLTACEDLIRRSLGDGINYRWAIDDDARHVLANGDQLELALLNLAINARDAMDGIGTFTISVTRDDGMAAVSACDDGPGVPPALRSRIFETYYSTKGDGKGTGLGLAQVAGAARQAGGNVALGDSASGGACFTIYLPLAEPPAS